MSELDLDLKVGARRLFWAMGLSTRLDVQLRGAHPPDVTSTRPGRRTGPQAFTDLDVLGVSLADGYTISTSVADCKTTQRESTSRMFWVRGVADLFHADHAYLVREREVSDAARQLANRLDVTVLTSPDLERMQHFYADSLPDPHGPLQALFHPTDAATVLNAYRGLDRQLRALLEFREFDYWVMEEHRVTFQLIAQLKAARNHLSADNPLHVALFLDLCWLFTLAAIRATQHVRRAYLGDVDRGLQEYLFGGAAALREKQHMAQLLRPLSPSNADALDVLPAYYRQLRELHLRLLRRPAHLQDCLRYLEATSAMSALRRPISVDELEDTAFNPIAAKLAADCAGFLTAAADLDPGFRPRARAYLLNEPVQTTAHITPSAPSQAAPAPTPPTQPTLLDTADLSATESERLSTPPVSIPSECARTTDPESRSEPHARRPS